MSVVQEVACCSAGSCFAVVVVVVEFEHTPTAFVELDATFMLPISYFGGPLTDSCLSGKCAHNLSRGSLIKCICSGLDFSGASWIISSLKDKSSLSVCFASKVGLHSVFLVFLS